MRTAHALFLVVGLLSTLAGGCDDEPDPGPCTDMTMPCEETLDADAGP